MKRINFTTRLEMSIGIVIILTFVILSGWALGGGPSKLDKDTIFSLHFDEGKGDEVKDASGNDNHGILGGAKKPGWIDGPETKFGSALEFSDANHVEIPDSAKLDTDKELTLEWWVKLKALKASWSTLYSKHGQANNAGFHWVYINQDETLAYQYCNGTQYLAPNAKVDWRYGEWMHLAITHQINEGKDGGMIKWYVDGKMIHEHEHSDNALTVVGGKASIATYQSNPALDKYAFDGALDEIRLSPRVKSEFEIVESMRGMSVEPYRKMAITWARLRHQ